MASGSFWRNGIRMKQRMLSFTCIYSIMTSLILVYIMLLSPEGNVQLPDNEGSRSRRAWLSDSIQRVRYVLSQSDRGAVVTASIPFLEDVSIEEDGEGMLNITEATNTEKGAMPLVNSSIVPGYFLLDSNEPLPRKCRLCSLVSNSGHLHESGAGVDIDNADCVLRMNTAPVTGWEEDVGLRTDMRIIGHVNLPRGLVKSEALRREILESVRTRARYIVVPWLYTESINMTTNKIVTLARDFKNQYPGVDFVFQTKDKYKEVEERFRFETGHSRSEMKTWFSTGFVSMLFALDTCEEVRVYGLANWDYCKQHPTSDVPYHYYEPTKLSECKYILDNEKDLHGGHKFMTERAMMARWSLIFRINFHYPSWRATIANTSAQIADTPYFVEYAEALKKNNGKLPKPEIIIKNGKRMRIIRKHVRRKPAAAPENSSNAKTSKNSSKLEHVEVHQAPRIQKKIVRRVVKKHRVVPKP